MATSMHSWQAGRWLPALALSFLLAACGGGGGDSPGNAVASDGVAALAKAAQAAELPGTAPSAATAQADPGPAAAEEPDPEFGPGLITRPIHVVDSTGTGQRRVVAVGSLLDGGHAVAWLSREPGDPGTAWPLWVQRFDAAGAPVDGPRRLDYPDNVAGPDDVAVSILPEGRVGLTFIDEQPVAPGDTVFRLVQVHHWPYRLDGSIDGSVRVLDQSRHAAFSPRLAKLTGPLVAAAGPDGSQYVAWQFRAFGAPPFGDDVRAQRLAADGDPLGWIQHLGAGSRTFGVHITPLDEGGWVVNMEKSQPGGVHFSEFVQLDVPRPLQFPLYYTHPAQARLLDLEGRGSVLFSGQLDTGTGALPDPFSLRFDAFGRVKAPLSLPTLPVSAVALRDGNYVSFEPLGAGLSAQRHSPGGAPIAGPVSLLASADALAAPLRARALVLAWVRTSEDGVTRVLSQRLVEAP